MAMNVGINKNSVKALGTLCPDICMDITYFAPVRKAMEFNVSDLSWTYKLNINHGRDKSTTQQNSAFLHFFKTNLYVTNRQNRFCYTSFFALVGPGIPGRYAI